MTEEGQQGNQRQESPSGGGEGQRPPASGVEEIPQTGPILTPLWAIILFVYLLLFTGTGYIAFLAEEFNPATSVNPEFFTQGADLLGEKKERYLELVLNAIQQESSNFAERRKLASQSFNVVLGALLGFLSASAAVVVGRQRRR